MSIAHFVTENSYRGGEQQIAILIDGLNERGYDNHIILKKGTLFEKYVIENGIQHLSITTFSAINIIAILQVIVYLKNNSISIIHAHSSKGHTFGYLCKLFGSPQKFILTRRVNFKISKKWFTQKKYTTKKLDQIVCISHQIRSSVISATNTDVGIQVIYSAINKSKFERAEKRSLRDDFKIDPDSRIIASASALDIDKDPFTFIKAAQYFIKNSDIKTKWVMFGEGPMKSEILTYIEKHNLENHIVLPGYSTQLASYFKDFNVFAITSTIEGLGSSILEAYLAKVPVIGTKTGGIPELIDDNKTGFIIEIGDFRALSQKVEQLLLDETLKQSFIHASGIKLEYFSPEIMVEKYDALYKSLA